MGRPKWLAIALLASSSILTSVVAESGPTPTGTGTMRIHATRYGVGWRLAGRAGGGRFEVGTSAASGRRLHAGFKLATRRGAWSVGALSVTNLTSGRGWGSPLSRRGAARAARISSAGTVRGAAGSVLLGRVQCEAHAGRDTDDESRLALRLSFRGAEMAVSSRGDSAQAMGAWAAHGRMPVRMELIGGPHRARARLAVGGGRCVWGVTAKWDSDGAAPGLDAAAGLRGASGMGESTWRAEAGWNADAGTRARWVVRREFRDAAVTAVAWRGQGTGEPGRAGWRASFAGASAGGARGVLRVESRSGGRSAGLGAVAGVSRRGRRVGMGFEGGRSTTGAPLLTVWSLYTTRPGRRVTVRFVRSERGDRFSLELGGRVPLAN